MQDVIQISTSAAVTLVVAYFLTVFAFGRLLLWQFERRADQRDSALVELRRVEAEHRSTEIAEVRKSMAYESSRIGTLTEKFDRFASRLPLEYVRREDYIRGQTVIEAKLDAISSELKLVQIQGARRAD
jgi:archaellum biogenesis protein FlaJ (TadC family)